MSANMQNNRRSSRGRGVSTRIGSAGGRSRVERSSNIIYLCSSPAPPSGTSADVFHFVTCKFPVLNNEEGGIAYDECEHWCHGTKVSTGLRNDFIKQVLKHQDKEVKYVCTKCRLQTPTVARRGKTDQAELMSLKEYMTQMFNTIAGLKNMCYDLVSRN